MADGTYGPGNECPFCDLPPERIVAHNDLAVAVRDQYPVSPGHTLIIPRRHIRNWWQATAAEREAIAALLDEVKQELDAEFRPAGYNIGSNDGEAAGQTVFHLHVHLIPRHHGDTADPRGGVRHVIPGRGNYLLRQESDAHTATPAMGEQEGQAALAGRLFGGPGTGSRAADSSAPGSQMSGSRVPGSPVPGSRVPGSPVEADLGTATDSAALIQQVLSVLDEGRRSATYKPALLLALVELAAERAEGPGELRLPLDLVAERVMELYWPQTRTHPDAAEGVLRQATGRSSRILAALQRLRTDCGTHPNEPLGRVRLRHADEFERARRAVADALAKQPVPRLQRPGATAAGSGYPRFLYDDRDYRQERGWTGLGERVIVLNPGVAETLARSAAVIRMAAQDVWTREVADINGLHVEEHLLRSFLFGSERVGLRPVADGLRDLGQRDCFWCRRPLSGQVEVDHVIPWSRYPSDDLFNLVLADARCNNDKRDRLVTADLVSRWAERDRAGLARLAAQLQWPMDPSRCGKVARSAYTYLPDGVALWAGPRSVELFDTAQRERVRLAVGALAA